MKIQFAAPCLFGLESFVADELRNIGAEAVAPENGRVFFEGDEHLLARATHSQNFLTASRRCLWKTGSANTTNFR